MRKLITTAIFGGLLAIGATSAAHADIGFTNTTSGSVTFTLQCPGAGEDVWHVAPGATRYLYCPDSSTAYFRVRTYPDTVVRGWVHDGEQVRLYRDSDGDVNADAG